MASSFPVTFQNDRADDVGGVDFKMRDRDCEQWNESFHMALSHNNFTWSLNHNLQGLISIKSLNISKIFPEAAVIKQPLPR